LPRRAVVGDLVEGRLRHDGDWRVSKLSQSLIVSTLQDGAEVLATWTLVQQGKFWLGKVRASRPKRGRRV
jgi:hypothetical protein